MHDCNQAKNGQPNNDNQQVPEDPRLDISNELT